MEGGEDLSEVRDRIFQMQRVAQQGSEGRNGSCIFKRETSLAGAEFASSSRGGGESRNGA